MTRTRRVATWVFGNFWLKLLSLSLALLLWMVVSGEETVERGLRVPLELTQVPAGLELLGDVPATVDVRVRGASGTLSRVGTGDVVAVLDLHMAQSGRRLFADPRSGARALRRLDRPITPSAVTMAFERRRHASADRGGVRRTPGPGSRRRPARRRSTRQVDRSRQRRQARDGVVTKRCRSKARKRRSADRRARLLIRRSAEVCAHGDGHRQILPAPLERTLRTSRST